MKFSKLIWVVVILFQCAVSSQETLEPGREKDLSRQVMIGDRLYLTKVFLDQHLSIEKFRTSKDTLALRNDVETLFKEYYPAWNDCFSYPKEHLYQLHLNYAESASSLIEHRTRIIQENNIDSIAKTLIAKTKAISGYSPSGNHFLLFMLDTDEFNMGGCDKNLMYVNMNNKDFSIDWFKRIFPHEINHQIYEETLPNANQDLLLWGIIDEGFASYVERLINDSSVAKSITLTEEEFAWCLDNEKEILRKVLPKLYSTKREDEMLLRTFVKRKYP